MKKNIIKYENPCKPWTPIRTELLGRFHRQVSLEILWTAALPRLATESKSSHALASRVALLDALLRGADDELLLSEAVRSAMDEFLGIQMVKTHWCESGNTLGQGFR